MSKVLIISDNPTISDSMKATFSNVGWASDSVNLPSVTQQGDYLVGQNTCVVLVIDKGFLARFSKYVEDIATMIRNCAICAPIYLVFEGDYDPTFASWLEYTKRLFKSITQPQKIQQAIEEIVRLETRAVPRSAYCSPMDAF